MHELKIIAHVEALYIELLNRRADPGGLQNWTAVAAREGLERVRSGIMASAEYQAKSSDFSGYSNSDVALMKKYLNSAAEPSPGFIVDVLGGRTRTSSLGDDVQHLDGKVMGIPVPGYHQAAAGEWAGMLKSVETAAVHYTAMELGAGWGPWIVAGALAAHRRGIREVRLYAVEADDVHFAALQMHLRDNGLDPAEHTLIHAAVGPVAGKAVWPVSSDSRNEWGQRPMPPVGHVGPCRTDYRGQAVNRTVTIDVVSAASLLRREPVWDLVHIDIQGHELEVCSFAIEELNGRVRWLIVGTHSRKIDGDLMGLMFESGWLLENEKPAKVLFRKDAPVLEAMTITDGIQVWKNPRLVNASASGP